jgi:endonuclease/exonuclease/phosphatase (EEP) superfamily protein YafD
MKDSFLEAGSGFGKTFEIKNFPMRIDFIFVDEILNVNEHKNYSINYSDHLPILARIGL